MKEYKDYMNQISGGAVLHKKIMDRVASHSQKVSHKVSHTQHDNNYPIDYNEYEEYEESTKINHHMNKVKSSVTMQNNYAKLRRKKHSIITLLAMTACAAGIVVGVLVVPGLLDRPAIILPNEIDETYYEESHEQESIEIESLPNQDGELIFNIREIVGYEWRQASWFLHYTREMSDEIFGATFPAVNINFDWVGIGYHESGDLVNIHLQETPSEWQNLDRPVNVRTNITISRWEMPRFLTYHVADDSLELQTSYIGGIPVMVTVYKGQGPVPEVDYSPPFDTVEIWARFEIDEIFYAIQVVDDLDSGKAHITELINQLIANGSVDLSAFDAVIIPVWGDTSLTIEEARSDVTFGQYVPRSCPEGFELDWANRAITPHENDLRLQWRPAGLPYVTDYIHMWIRKAEDVHDLIVVAIDNPAAYDWSYHPVFIDNDWHDALVGTQEWWTILNPVFRIEDLSYDIIETRTYWHNPDIQFPWHVSQFSFSVLDGDVLIYIYSNMSIADGRDRASILWEMLRP